MHSQRFYWSVNIWNDFIDSIKVQIKDLVKVGEKGYAEGISEIFINNLQQHNLELYIRGNTAGIIDKNNDNTKYRFKRLELEEQYRNLLEFEKTRQKEIENIKEIQRQNKEKDRER